MHHLDRAVGSALRRARDVAGLTLKDVERLTEGRFKPSTVAGYERGERSISVSRFLALARFYGALPDGLLTDAMASSRHDVEELVVVLPGGDGEIRTPVSASDRNGTG